MWLSFDFIILRTIVTFVQDSFNYLFIEIVTHFKFTQTTVWYVGTLYVLCLFHVVFIITCLSNLNNMYFNVQVISLLIKGHHGETEIYISHNPTG